MRRRSPARPSRSSRPAAEPLTCASTCPAPDVETQPFWDGTKEGRFLVRHCLECGEYHFYPRPFCPKCWSERVEWVEASGRAVLYTYSIVVSNDLPPFNERVPYVAAVVDLEEGPRVMTNVVDCEFDDLPRRHAGAGRLPRHLRRRHHRRLQTAVSVSAR